VAAMPDGELGHGFQFSNTRSYIEERSDMEKLKVINRLGMGTLPLAAVAAIAVGAFASRAQAAGGDGATYLCRAVATGETPNAAMTAGSSTALECREVSLGLKMSDGSMRTIGRVTATSKVVGPDLSSALTPQQVNDAWIRWTAATFNITHSP
jgi:hypothetical protein